MNEKTSEIMTFPCTFPIKAMGHAKEGFEKTVIDLIGQHSRDIESHQVMSRLSRNGKFLSITVTINADSRAQLDDIYHALTGHEDVLVAL